MTRLKGPTFLFLIFLGSVSEASKVLDSTLKWLTPAHIQESLDQPDTKTSICEMLFERGEIVKDLAEFKATQDGLQRQIDAARAHLGPYGLFHDRYIMAQDWGEKVRPSKLIKKATSKVWRTERDLARFDVRFDQRLIDALKRGSKYGYHFQRLLDERERYEQLIADVTISVKIVDKAFRRLQRAEELRLVKGKAADVRMRIAERKAHAFVNENAAQVRDTFSAAARMHMPLIDTSADDRIEGSADMIRYQNSARQILNEAITRYESILQRLVLIKSIAVSASQTKPE